MKYGLIWTLCVALTFAANAANEVDVSKSAEADGTIEVKIVAGSIEIIGWDRNEIQIQGSIGEDIDEFIFEVDGDDATIEVKVSKSKRNSRSADKKAILKISVPKRSTIEAKAVSGPITMTSVTGDDHELRTVSGRLTVDDCQGDLDVEVVSGSIEVDGQHDSVDAETVSGSVTVRGTSNSLDVETVSGSITVDGDDLGRCSLEVLSGKIKFEGTISNEGRMDIESFSGTVTVNFTDPVYGRYDIETFSGGINCGFGPTPKKKNRFTPGRTLNFTHGDGDARINIESFSGSVTITEP